MEKVSVPYKALCAEYYEIDKPTAPDDALQCYLEYAREAKGPILEPMCGTGRFLLYLLEKGYTITGFDSSPHMLEVCQKKCQEKGLTCTLLNESLETFSSETLYSLAFIPTASFCLLTQPGQVNQALQNIYLHLIEGGKFVFEVDTLNAVSRHEEIWKGKWSDKADGSKIVRNTLSRFDPASRIETILCRYELWEKNAITWVEVEDYRLRLYDMPEIEGLLKQHGFKIVNKWTPYLKANADEKTCRVLYECVKVPLG